MNIAFEARDPFGGAFGELEAALSSIEGVGEVTNETPKFSWPGAAPAIEVIWIYLGLKAADKVAGRIVERAFDAAVSWARKTLKAEKNVPSEGPRSAGTSSMQRQLRDLDLLAKRPVTGVYDVATVRAVMTFQSSARCRSTASPASTRSAP